MRRLLPILSLIAALAAPSAASAWDLPLPDSQPRLAYDLLTPVERAEQSSPDDQPSVDGTVTEGQLRRTLETLEIRRNMLVAHQVLAWTSAFTIIAADVIGLINRIAIQTGSIHRADLEGSLAVHRVLVATASASYWTAGVLAWTMPSPTARREHKGVNPEWEDTRNTHIILSVIHAIAMGTVIATGILQANVLPPEAWEPLIFVHTSAGFVAAGFVLSASIVIARM